MECYVIRRDSKHVSAMQAAQMEAGSMVQHVPAHLVEVANVVKEVSDIQYKFLVLTFQGNNHFSQNTKTLTMKIIPLV